MSNNNNEEQFTQKFISANEKLRKMLPEMHDMILSLSPFTENQIQISNAWTNFKQMDFWISCVMKEAFEMMSKSQPQVKPEGIKE